MIPDPRIDAIPQRPFLLPAWAMSLLLHAALFVLLALLVNAAPPKAAEVEPERSVGIVLARHHAASERTYFDEQEAAIEQSGGPAAADSSMTAAESLPAADQAPGDPSQALPSLEGAFAADDNPLGELTLSPKGRPGLYSREGEAEIIAADLAAQKGRGGPVGPPTDVSLFGSAPARGHSFVFVIDRSQSMGDAGLGVLQAAESELERSLAALQANHRFQIIAYNKTPLAFQPRGLAPATNKSKLQAIEFIRNLIAFGGTGHYMALLAALRLEPDVIFFLTDGGDPRLTTPEIEEIVRRARGRTTVYSVQFGAGPSSHDSDRMRILAERTRGSYSYVDMSRRK